MGNNSHIRDRSQLSELVVFGGLQWGSIKPTDIDMFVDFGNRVFVITEYKHGGADLPGGQKLALERLADAATLGGVPTVVIVADWMTKTADNEIDAAAAIVRCMYWQGKWWNRSDTVKDFINKARGFFMGAGYIKWRQLQKEGVSDGESTAAE